MLIPYLLAEKNQLKIKLYCLSLIYFSTNCCINFVFVNKIMQISFFDNFSIQTFIELYSELFFIHTSKHVLFVNNALHSSIHSSDYSLSSYRALHLSINLLLSNRIALISTN